MNGYEKIIVVPRFLTSSAYNMKLAFSRDFHQQRLYQSYYTQMVAEKAQIIEFIFNNLTVQIANLHCDPDNTPFDVKIRQSQIATTISEMSGEVNIICGDINAYNDENLLLPETWIDMWKILYPSLPGYTYDTDVNLFTNFRRRELKIGFTTQRERFDRFFVQNKVSNILQGKEISIVGNYSFEVEGKKNIFPSDHLGLLLTLSVI